MKILRSSTMSRSMATAGGIDVAVNLYIGKIINEKLLLPPFQNIRYFSFVKQKYVDIF
jgi:hypothetical protein